MLVRPPMTSFKMTVRADCAVSACSPLPQPIKRLAPDRLGVGGSWPLDRCPPSCSTLCWMGVWGLFSLTVDWEQEERIFGYGKSGLRPDPWLLTDINSFSFQTHRQWYSPSWELAGSPVTALANMMWTEMMSLLGRCISWQALHDHFGSSCW